MLVNLSQNEIVANLEGFRDWVKANCKGRENGEAKIYLDRFFQCFGHGGVLEAKGVFEFAQKASSKKGNIGFLDCLFPGVALIEMKQRGASLAEHYNQLLTYWTHCVPKPTVGILCNFDEFWIYDFNVQVDTPVQTLTLDELSLHPEALLFMLGQKPRFNQNMVDITEDAAAEISKLYRSILARRDRYGATEEDIQRFVLQCVLCLFAEDIGLLPPDLFTALLSDCTERPQDSYHLLHSLFTQMNSKKPAKAGRFSEVPYFNGGLFDTITPVELDKDELTTLHEIGYKFRWEKVRPSIFGTIFEKAIGHHQGSHFTSEVDIYKIVNPTIVRYWDERIEAAGDNVKQLQTCLSDIRTYRVLDPACGSGNFLYIAFQELKRLEKVLMDRIKDTVETSSKKFTAKRAEGTDISLVSPLQFYGIEIKPFAVELARLTLEIGRKVAVNKFGLTEHVLPLDNLNNNIICADALFTPWPEADAIIGNPPFIGNKYLRRDLGSEYVEKLYHDYPEVSGKIDYCAFWFYLSHKTSAKRIGLVGTNTISQGHTRKASLDYIVENNGTIYDAISSQIWSGDANVHVSIVNWAKYSTNPTFLDGVKTSIITSSLAVGLDIRKANKLGCNKKKSFEACHIEGKGFILTPEEGTGWLEQYPNYRLILKKMIDGNSLINRFQELNWVIDFDDLPIEEASKYEIPFKRVSELVKPFRQKNPREPKRVKYWQFGERQPTLRGLIKRLDFYFALPKVSKFSFFQAVESSTLPCEANMVVASDDFYVLGVLNSKLHRDWVKAQCSTLKGDTRYTNTTCFETFPFLWDADEKLKQPVRDIMTELETYRMHEMKTRQWGITKLYNAFFNEPASQLYKLHKKLDETVCKVYGWPYDPDKNYNEDLFYLNQKLYQQEQAPLLAKSKPVKPKKAKPS